MKKTTYIERVKSLPILIFSKNKPLVSIEFLIQKAA